MEELLAQTGYKLKGFKRGETVTGKVTEIAGRSVLVDIGGKTEAVVSEQEYELSKDYLKTLKPGDEVTAVVVVTESDSWQVILSLRRAAADSRWKAFEEAMEENKTVTGLVKEVTKGGLLVELEGIYGFVPASQLGREMEGNMAALVDKPMEVKVIEVDRAQNRLVLSERAVSEAGELEKRKKALGGVKVGGEYEGEVHISEISWEKVEEVGRVLKEGDKVKVQVIGIDEENGKLALSVKRLSDDPWLVVAAKYPVDSKHRGVVTKMAPYGILVKLERGIEGLIHASKMPAEAGFKEGDEVEVFVESVDLEKRRLSLGVVLSTKPVGYK